MSRIVWGEAALALFQLTGPTAVSAGAGSGKTTCLVELCLRLLSGEATGTPCEPGELVAITFTEKAAAELEERLREALAARAAAAPAGSEEARAWRLRLAGLERMAVGTIHAFAGRLLREHALEAGVDPALEVLDEETSQLWRREAARAALVAALDAGRPEARRLATAHGAGGRRGGLAELVAELARERATLGEEGPARPAASDEGAARAARAAAIAAAEALLAARSEVKTATGARALGALREALDALGEDRSGALRAEALSRFDALAGAVRPWRVGASDGPDARGRKAALIDACEAFGPLAAEVLADPQKLELAALVTEAEARYAARKGAGGALDFDDLLARARALLRGDAALRAELRGRVRALLVDEYQDVNALQEELFQLLSRDEPGLAPGPVLVAVGDLKQSIYRFRGADVAVFRGVLERLAATPPGRALHLSVNHRSGPGVLALVNEVFARCMQPAASDPRPYELAFSEADRLVPVRPPGQAPACELLEDGEGGPSAERRVREARAVAARVQALVSGAAGVEVRERGESGAERGRTPRHGDVAILFRRLTEVETYVRALREAGVPFRLGRGGGFYQAPEVRDLGELAAALTAPDDALAWAALLRSPLCGVSDGVLFALSRLGLGTLARREPEAVVEAVWAMFATANSTATSAATSTAMATATATATSTSTEAERAAEGERLLRFLRAWHALRALVDRVPVDELLRRALALLDLEAAHLASPDGERRCANVRKAVALARRFAQRGGGAAGFAARLRTLAAREAREPEAEVEAPDAVALLSVHQAKGLEWPIVFVPDLGATPPRDGRRAARHPTGALALAFADPEADRHHPTAALEAAREEGRRAAAAESRRLLYVALTRARDRLVLSGEAGRAGDTWRALVEAGLAARPELASRVPLAEAGAFRVGAGATATATANVTSTSSSTATATSNATSTSTATSTATSNATAIGARGAGDVAPPRLARPAPPPAVRVAVTALAEHARCPRRVHFSRQLGLPELAGERGPSQDDPDRATARGTLAHAMLAEVDLAAPPLERRVLLAAAASRRGYDPRSPGVRRIAADVSRFLDAPSARRLARAAAEGRLRREVPFLLRLGGDGAPLCYLTGAIDALLEERGGLAVVDFKYALCRPGAAERYRLQLVAYALAAARAFPGQRVTASLQFLRGPCAAVDVTPTQAELRQFAREAPRLAQAVQAGEGYASTPAALGRDAARCRSEGCGYLARCFPGDPSPADAPRG
ncbi:UvrD-helicase domain-containing protein [Anaeromyxobacter diazotrophicus]|uniref:DNA 3'-5' helicase n=1 Tax=Anaeromyxobacter diazotrophicus TaxID=2590199 RepID=A0A7I9VPC2_9BACT|nr:UvrD-helicase domain-containing protein [Anaeromyxobacter diazotrophicus]GEJ57960.1 hypothetical protein AMYX_27010 [Anaeromyxobacter diazotrophicus]